MDDAGARLALRDAWSRRDLETLNHLFSYCSLSSVDIPALGDEVGPGAKAAQARMQLELGDGGDGEAAIADGVLAVGLYFQGLLGWEETDDFANIEAFVRDAASALDLLARDSRFRSVAAARRMLESLPYQCRTEEARLCACSYSLELTAGNVLGYLKDVPTDQTGVHPIDDSLLELVHRDVDNARTFYRSLATVVGPLAGRFADALLDTSGIAGARGLSAHRASVRTAIRDALPQLEQDASDLSAAGEVLGGELEVQAAALALMADAMEAPSLALDHGQLTYVYPFSFDDRSADSGIDEEGENLLRLVGLDGAESVRFQFEEVRRTDAWRFLLKGTSEVLTVFEDRGQLVLADGLELRLRPKWIEMEEDRGAQAPGSDYHQFSLRVVLGFHGGHSLHLSTQIGERAGVADPWSGAHVDQWVRRLSADAGAERLSLHRGDEMILSWGTLHDFAGALVDAIGRLERGGEPSDPTDDGEDDTDLAGASIIFQIDGARVVAPNGTARRLRPGDEIEKMTGYSALMATARYLPASVEEWIRLGAPPPENLLDGLRPFGDTLLVNGDVMTLLTLGSPNWVVLEQVEILEFAISLQGYLEHLSDRLRRRLRVGDATGAMPTKPEVTAAIREGNRVLELLRSRGLMRSRYHAEFLARLSPATGLHELETRVEKMVEALRDVRRDLEEEEQNRLSRRLDVAVYWLTVVTVFIAVHQFLGSFFAENLGSLAQVGIASLAAAATAAFVIGYERFRRPGRRG